MKTNKCRVCGNIFFEGQLLQFENMPSQAQNLPDKEMLQKDKGVDLDVYQCSGCGLVQLNSEPVVYYKDVIRAAAISKEMQEFRMKQFKNFIEKYSLKEKKIIEIGCGRGEYLSIMNTFDVKALGLEDLRESVSECKKNGLNVSKGFVENSNYKIANGPYDAFYILNFLEHLPDPNAVLRGIFGNLADGAVGLVEVPNFDMILEKNLFSEFIGDHLFYFTKDTLKLALDLNGFELIELSEIWQNYIISAVVRKKPKLVLLSFYQYQSKLQKEMEEYISRFGNKSVAIWGAGHQALAIISLANLADKIKYVVDSAPFKQGKYTPASHIPIVSPNMLHSDPVEAVIVMAASYSDEVARTIRGKFVDKIKIAILRDFGLEII